MTLAKDKKIVDTLADLFVDENKKPLEYTKTQKDIIYSIAMRTHNRVGIIAPTQYGKSTAIAIGIIIRVILKPESFIIVGGTKSKSEIIMGYILQHLFDNKGVTAQIEIDGNNLEKLKRERRRDHITFKNGGEIKAISADYINSKRVGDKLLGEGAQNIIVDDSVLCSDATYAFIKRMAGGHKDNFLLESANPLKRNHFYRTMTNDKAYHKIWINEKTALKEGRFTPEFLDEMKHVMFYDVFYACRFPSAESMDEEGYQPLLTEQEINNAVGVPKIEKHADNRFGVDIARGGNRTVFAVRNDKQADIYFKALTPNLMLVVGKVIETCREFVLPASAFCLDDTGMGGGVTNRLQEQSFFVNPVVLGGKAEKIEGSKIQYMNIRAKCFWELREWIRAGGIIPNDENLILQLKLLKYRVNSSGVIQIQPKEKMELDTGESPDEADALALTFAEDEIPRVEERYSEVQTHNEFRSLGITDGDLRAFGMKGMDE